MYLFILESIGMQELVLIGTVALIVFGPRKLPGMAKKAGKLMAEFRKATSDFKDTWEKEVQFEEFRMTDDVLKSDPNPTPTIAQGGIDTSRALEAPEVKEIRQEDFEKHFPTQPVAVADAAEEVEAVPPKVPSGKRDWL